MTPTINAAKRAKIDYAMHQMAGVFLLLLFTALAHGGALPDWATRLHGRGYTEGYHSVDPRICAEFIPSGALETEIQHKGLLVRFYHGLYFSDEENPDTSKDQLASVIIYQDGNRVFVARGYRFGELGIKSLGFKSKLAFTHWSGVMGDKQIQLFSGSYQDKQFQLDGVSQHSTKGWPGMIRFD